MGERLPDRSREPVGQVAAELLRMVRGDRFGDDGLEVDVVGHRGIRFELLVHLRHSQLPDAIADRVVHDRPDRGAAPLHTVDQHETPQRPGAVERLLVELGGQIEQLAVGARLRQPDVSNVEVDVELGIGNPRRRCQPTETGNDPLVQARDLRDRSPHRAAEVLSGRSSCRGA